MTSTGRDIRDAGHAMRAGAARRDITPPIGIYSGMWGAATWDQVTGVHRPLTATAIALEDERGERSILVSLDHGAWRRTEDEDSLRSAVLTATGLEPRSVIIALTHTHSSCSLCPEDAERPGGEHIVPYLATMTERVVEAVLEASDSMRPAVVQWARTDCTIAGNRDQPAEGRYLVGWNEDVDAETAVLVGRIHGEDGVIATIVNYACHGTTLAWENSLLSPDFVGAMRELIETEVGGYCLFMQGAEGDIAPRMQYSGDPENADRLGRSLGHAVLGALLSMPDPAASPPSHATDARIVEIELPLKPAESLEALALRFWPELDDRTRGERIKRATWRRRNAGTGETCAYPIWVWEIAGAIVVAQPGEAYSALQRELRARHPELPILVVSLVNGPVWTYFPTRDMFEHNVYTVWHTPFLEGGHEAVLETADRAIGELVGARR